MVLGAETKSGFSGVGDEELGEGVCARGGHRLRKGGEEVGFLNTRTCDKTLKERGEGNLEGY